MSISQILNDPHVKLIIALIAYVVGVYVPGVTSIMQAIETLCIGSIVIVGAGKAVAIGTAK